MSYFTLKTKVLVAALLSVFTFSTSMMAQTEESPYTVAQALAVINSGTIPTEAVYVKGKISSIKEVSTSFGNATYNLSDDGTTTSDQLNVYRGKYLGGVSFTSAFQINVGDEVVVKGVLVLYGGKTAQVNTNSEIVSINGKKVDDVVPMVFNSLAAAKAAATATQTLATLNIASATVVFTNGNYNFITDGVTPFLLYGSAGLATGQKFSGSVTGDLYITGGGNGITELSYNKATSTHKLDLTIGTETASVEPTVLAFDDFVASPRSYESLYVTIQGLTLGTAFTNRDMVAIKDGEELALRDQWNLCTTATYDVNEIYDVSGIVTFYNGNPQLYIINKDDLKMVTDLKVPTGSWKAEEHLYTAEQSASLIGTVIDEQFTTNSNGKVSYSSSNEAVASVSADGKITINGYGKAVITATTDKTSSFLSASFSVTISVMEGDGTLQKPYSYNDVLAVYKDGQATEPVYIKGYVVGYATGGSLTSATFSPFVPTETTKTATNLLLAPSAIDTLQFLPVQLPAAIRATLQPTADMQFGKEIIVLGTIEKYFTVAGIKNVKEFYDAAVGISGVNAEATRKENAIYNLRGERVQRITGSGIYIVNGKKILVK